MHVRVNSSEGPRWGQRTRRGTDVSKPETQVRIDTSEMNVLFVHSALDDYPLTPEEFRLYSHLARRAGSGTAYPAVASMAKSCRMHPDTTRRCLTNLVTYRMLEAHARKGRTTLYILTRFSRWVKPEVVLAVQGQQEAEGKAKRAEKKARKLEAEANPPVMEGGVLGADNDLTPMKRREGYPYGTEGGDPPETKGDEGNPLNISLEGSGVRKLTGEASEETPAAALVVEQGPQLHTTFEAAPLKDFEPLGEPVASVAVLPPDGGTADAAITDSDLEFLFGPAEGPQETRQAESGQKVPGGGAAALLAQLAGRDEALRPLDRKALLERPLAMPSDTTYRMVKGLVGGNKAIDDGILDTLTPAGALPRRDWLRLSEEELTDARRVAQAEAQAETMNFYTCSIRALDLLIGAPIRQTGQRGKPMTAVVANAGCHAPAQHFEDADRSGDVGKFDAGAGWIRKADQEAVTIARTELVKRRNTDGLVYHLSDGGICNALQLMTGYEFQVMQTEA